ncbi:MAG: hypothetical protein Q9217_002125 [Psora testacea]
MSGPGRRTSARLADKEDVPLASSIGHGYEPVNQNQTAPPSKRGKVNAPKAGAKRKPAYEEEDDGFAFTRTRSKKAKVEPSQPPLAEEPAQQQRAEPAPSKKTKKRVEDRPKTTGPSVNGEERTNRRRSPRNSGEGQNNADPPPLPVKKRRKGRGSDEGKNANEVSQVNAGESQQREDGNQEHIQPIELTVDSTKIALPFADTPIIRRNQEMRRGVATGSRRSSLGLRGRRASSLIDTGKSNALPHDEVESAEFYKHIESEGISEPRRMRQLLTWCGTRALGNKPSFRGENGNAILAAREIQSQLLKDFTRKSNLSDWFSRDERPPPPSPPKPNPKNAANQAKIQELEQQLARLQTERQTWDSLLRPPLSSSLPCLSSNTTPDPSTIEASLLPPPSQAILSSLTSSAQQPSLAGTTRARLREITSNLEFNIDTFATNVHSLHSYTNVAGRLADEALGICAKLLDERDREGVRRANGGTDEQDDEEQGGKGMRDILRGLSRVIDER